MCVCDALERDVAVNVEAEVLVACSSVCSGTVLAWAELDSITATGRVTDASLEVTVG